MRFFNAWHSDEDQADGAFIEDVANLFKTGHAKAVGLIDAGDIARRRER
nr:hypothetical protein [Granulicella aggregans]